MTVMHDGTALGEPAVSDTRVSRRTEPRWRAATLVAFRLCFVYFGLYVATTQMLPGMLRVPLLRIPLLGVLPPARTVFLWVGTHVLGISTPIRYALTGSGDRLFDWVQAFSLALSAVVIASAWSVIDRRRDAHPVLYRSFRLFVRFALGTTMVGYGWSKVIPLQMPVVFLTRLVEPFGSFSPMGVLWSSIGAAPAYETVVGCAELAGGALLFVPRTTMLGALICLMDAIAIFTLNMTYDVPVKLFSFHLILMSLFLLAPNIRPLVELLLLNRPATARVEPPLGRSMRTQRLALAAQIVYGAWFVLSSGLGSVQGWYQVGGGAPKSPLFGIWEVEAMSVDGQPRPPLLTDQGRWRRVIFQAPTAMAFQRMDDSFERYGAAIDTGVKTIVLSSGSAKAATTLSFDRPVPERLIVDGPINGRVVHLELKLREPNSFMLASRGFNWIQETPFNR